MPEVLFGSVAVAQLPILAALEVYLKETYFCFTKKCMGAYFLDMQSFSQKRAMSKSGDVTKSQVTNLVELRVLLLTVRFFLQSAPKYCDVLICLGNGTIVRYINYRGGMRKKMLSALHKSMDPDGH